MTEFSKTANCNNCELKSNLFCYLTNDELSKINDERREVTFEPGETIFKYGGPQTHIFCLTSGMVKICLEDAGNKRILLDVIKPVKLIGGPGFLVDGRHHYTVTALEKSTACYISVEDFRDVMKTNAEFSMEIVTHLNKLIIKYLNRINSIANKHMPGKMAEVLLHLSDDVYNSDTFDTSLSRQDLADMSALAKESSIRVLKDFNEEGVISFTGNHFEILDKEKLRKISVNG